jgi:uncharacterized membrane protein
MFMTTDLGTLDFAACAIFATAWAVYELAASRATRRGKNLAARMHIWRIHWMESVLERDNRILDVQILRSLVGNSSFLASTAIFVIGGLAALLGASAEIVPVINRFDFVESTGQNRFGLQVSLLILIFMNAFFRLAWSMRLHNNAAVVLGSIPQPKPAGEDPEFDRMCKWRAEICAELVSLAAKHYNGGMHAYYFGLAAVAWFLHPFALIAASLWVVATLYRREFRSKAYGVLAEYSAD